jgi:ABC-type Fe3+-hydroxamate transport system substrate-binding protein
VVGITKFCVHPEKWFRTKTRVGGTKTLNIEKIKGLQPDLVIANREENTREQIEALQKFTNVYVSDIKTLDDALQMIQIVGDLTGKQGATTKIVHRIVQQFEQLAKTVQKDVAYFIWRNPYMAAGNDTFIHDMISRVGWRNIYEDLPRYPEVDINDLKSRNPDLILLSSEPYPFRQKHIDELQEHLPGTKIILADGEMFSWHGSRMLYVPAYIKSLMEEIEWII